MSLSLLSLLVQSDHIIVLHFQSLVECGMVEAFLLCLWHKD